MEIHYPPTDRSCSPARNRTLVHLLAADMFDLHSLGWNSFQLLCLTVAREVLGQVIESFLDSNDGGRDGAFIGTWNTQRAESMSGRFVIQCKFTSKPDKSLRPADLTDELIKAKRLVAAGLCDSYVLMTNAALSGRRVERVEKLFKSVGVKHVTVLGATWIKGQILENKRLRMLVPRVYGLGDLSQILDERAYAQARAVLEMMREDLSKVVVTDAYRKAIEAINRHSFVLLIGEPAAGKTTIASLLAMAALDQWDTSVLKLDEPGKVVDHWNPEEPSQFFWLDDAFGVTQYEDSLVRRWNHVLPRLPAMIRRGAKIVMTSRDYIYNRARNDLKESAFPLLSESQVVIDVHDLTVEEKRQILYNHLRLGKQPRSFRREVKPYLEQVAAHNRFIPETARRLSDPIFTRNLRISSHQLRLFVDRREQLLQEILSGLDIDSKAALALIYMRSGHLQSPVELQPPEREALERLGSGLGGSVAALKSLAGSLVVLREESGELGWNFKHPTIGDAYADILSQSPEHLGIFIRGSAPERLLDRVVCGNVDIEKAVVVPRSLYPQMFDKLEAFSRSDAHRSAWLSAFSAKSKLQGFLARRCDKEFLLLYLKRYPELLEEVSQPGLYLDTVPEVGLAVRLHEVGMLPERNRVDFVKTVSDYAVEGRDGDALANVKIKTLFTDDEFEHLLHRVGTELLPRLDDVRLEWESDYSSRDSPEEHVQHLLELYEALKSRFKQDEAAIEIIEREVRRTDDWIVEHAVEVEIVRPRELGAVEGIDKPYSMRSIFDDVDAN